MTQARILKNGVAIRIDGFTDLSYGKEGWLYGFKTPDGKIYSYCHTKNDEINKSNYYLFDEFLDYLAKGKRTYLTPFNANSISAQPNDEIQIYRRELSASPGFNTVCWKTYKFDHVKGTFYKNGNKIKLPNGIIPSGSPNCTHEITAQKFYDDFIVKAYNDESFANILADILQSINSIERDIFQPLYSNTQISTYIDNQRNLWKDGITFNYATKEEYFILFQSLYYFRLYYLSYKRAIDNDFILIMIYLASVFSSKALEILPLSTKIDMLNRLAKGDFDNWQMFYYRPEDDASTIANIINSITVSQSDQFLELFEDKFVHFYTSLSGENKKKFIFALYNVWVKSGYNPYQNGVFNQTNFDRYTYNKQLATCPDANNPIFYDFIDTRAFNYSSSPIILDYQSSSALGIFFDNFNFYLTSNTGPFGNNRKDFTYKFRFFNNADELPFNRIAAVKDNYTISGDDALYGIYTYYQPISLINSNQDGIMKIPVIDASGSSVNIAGHPEKINSLIPIFVLLYIDDAGDESDFYTTLGYVVDIASIFIGGYGFLTKLRYLRGVSGFTPAIIGGSEYGPQVLVRLYATVTFEGISLTSGTISFFCKLCGDAYVNEPWFQKMTTILTWIELFSAGGSLVSEVSLKIAIKNIVNDFNANSSWPAEFLTDARGIEARNTLTQIAGMADEVTDALYSQLKTKIIERVKTRISTNSEFSLLNANGVALHSDIEIENILRNAYYKGLPPDEIEGLFFVSYRVRKRISASQLIQETNLWLDLKNIRKYPYNFNSLAEFEVFKNNVKLKVSDYGIPNFDIRVQGSALRRLNPDDIDLAIIVDQSEISALRKKFLDRAKIKYGSSDSEHYKKFVKDMDDGIAKGKIESNSFGKLPGNNNTFIQDIYATGPIPKPNISIIIKNGKFYYGPYLKF